MKKIQQIAQKMSYRGLNAISPKWTKKQDQKLRQAVQKYGTQWNLISKKYKFQRSINSLVKRWHGKLKDQPNKNISDGSDSQSEQKQESVVQKTKKISKKVQVAAPLSNSQSSSQQSQQQQVTTSHHIQVYEFQRQWKQSQDFMLKDLVINQKVLNWNQLSERLKIYPDREVRRRWQKVIYPSVIESRKIGGCVKYSQQQDIILSRGVRLGMTVQQLRKFLPIRTLYSLDARRRRTLRSDQQQIPQLRYWTKRMNAFRFVQKRHEHIEKPASEEHISYRSESQ